MKVRIKRSPPIVAETLRHLSIGDPSTGLRRRFDTPDTLKARVPLELVVAQCLGHEGEDVGAELRFLCPFHRDTSPSLWVNAEKQRWGCNTGCYRSGDVYDFIQKLNHEDFKGAVDWVKKWDASHNHTEGKAKSPSARKRRRE